jgi:hypothetical protein
MMIAPKPEKCGADSYGRLEAIETTRRTTPLAEAQNRPPTWVCRDADTLAHPALHSTAAGLRPPCASWLATLRRRVIVHLRLRTEVRDYARHWTLAPTSLGCRM